MQVQVFANNKVSCLLPVHGASPHVQRLALTPHPSPRRSAALSLELELELGDPFCVPTHTSTDSSEGAPLLAASAPVVSLSPAASRPIRERSHRSGREGAGSNPEQTAGMEVVQHRQDVSDEGPPSQEELSLLPLPASLSWPLYDPLTGEWAPHSPTDAPDNASRQTERVTSVSSASSHERRSLQSSRASGEHSQASSTSLPPRLAPLRFSFERPEAAEAAIVHTTATRPREVASTSRLRHKRPLQRASASPPALSYDRSDVSSSASPSSSSSHASSRRTVQSSPSTSSLTGEAMDVRYSEVPSAGIHNAAPASISTTLDFFHMYSIPPLGTTSASSAIAMPQSSTRPPDASFASGAAASATTSAHRHSPPAAAEIGARVKRRRSGTRHARNEDDDESFVASRERSVRRASSRSTVDSGEMGESALLERYPSRISVPHPFAQAGSVTGQDWQLASFTLDSSPSEPMPGEAPAEPAPGPSRTREQTPLTRYIDTLLANEEARAGSNSRPRTLQQHLTGTEANTTRAASPMRHASPHARFEASQAQPVSPVVATVTAVPSLPVRQTRPSLARSSPSVSERRGNEAPFSLGSLPRFHFDAAADSDVGLISPRGTAHLSAHAGTAGDVSSSTTSPRGRFSHALSPQPAASTPGIRRPNLQRNATAVSPPEESPLNTPEVDPAGHALTPPTAGNAAVPEYPRSSFFRQHYGRASLATAVRGTTTAQSAGGAWAGNSGRPAPGPREPDSLWQYVWNEEDERRRAEDLLRSFETSRRITDEIRSFDAHTSSLVNARHHRLRGTSQRPTSADLHGSEGESELPLSLLESWESSLPSISSGTSSDNLSSSLVSSQSASSAHGRSSRGLWGTLPAEPISGNLLQSTTSRRADSSSGDLSSSLGSTRSRRPGSLWSGTMRGPTRASNENWLRSQGIDFHHDSSSTTASAGAEPRSSPFAHGASSTPNHPWRTGRTAPLVGPTRTATATGVSVSAATPSSTALSDGTAQDADAAERTLRRMPHRPFVPIARHSTRFDAAGRDSPRLDGIRPVSPLFEMAEDSVMSSAADRAGESMLTRRQSALWSHLEHLRRLIAAPAGAEASTHAVGNVSVETTHRNVPEDPVEAMRPTAASSSSPPGVRETDHISGLEAELANIRAMMDQVSLDGRNVSDPRMYLSIFGQQLERNRPVQRVAAEGPTRATRPEAQTQGLLDLQVSRAGQSFWSRPAPVHARGRFVPPPSITPAGATSRLSRHQGLDVRTESMRPGNASRQPFDDIFAEVEAEFAGRNRHRTASTPTRRRSRTEMMSALEDASMVDRDGDARQTRTASFMDGLLRGLDDTSPSLVGTDSLSSTGAEVASGSGASITSTPAGYAPQVSSAAPPRLSVDFMDTMGPGWDRLGLHGSHPVFGEDDGHHEDGTTDTLFRAFSDGHRDIWATESSRPPGRNDIDGDSPGETGEDGDENAMSSGRVPLPPFLLRSIHARRRNIFGNREPGITHTRPLYAGTGGSGIAFESRNYLSDLDLDLSYEGLLALSESIGEARPRGASDLTLNTALRKFLHGTSTSAPSASAVRVATMAETRCGICLEDYEEGDECAESVKCGHAMHAVCFEVGRLLLSLSRC